ncbi:MAG: hypothetical protein ACI93R_003442 [Flavobacteriales bacterium]|jgi:uncharacterized protein YaiI (UPF0178 family)
MEVAKSAMQMWVDADACPVVIRDQIVRAAERREIHCYFVANSPLRLPKSPYIHFILVQSGFDAADDEIVARINVNDLLISSDIPLAAEAMEKGAHVITPRGERYTPENIRARLNMRDFMETMRSSGVHSGGPPPLNQQDRKAFADQFDRLLQKLTVR